MNTDRENRGEIVMNKEEIATTYEEYKNGAKQVAGLGRLGCYQGLYYLNKLLEEDKYYSEKLEDSIVFIESHINRIEKENKKYKEVIDKINNYIDNYDIFKVFSFPLMKRWEEEQVKSSIDYEFKTSLIKDLKDIVKEVE